MAALFTKYRPDSWDKLIGHARLKLAIKRMRSKGTLGGRAFVLSGSSGIGKSSAAYLIAQDICDSDNIIEVNATTVTPKTIQDWSRTQGQLLIGNKSGKAIIINEVHKMRTDVVTLLLEVLEHVKDNVVWIFTTQGKSQMGLFDDGDSSALESRCIKFELTIAGCEKQMAESAMRIAEDECLDGAPYEAYVSKLQELDYNFRALLSAIEAGEFLQEECDAELLMELEGVA